ncbi:NACHT domain-containing protein [Prescottella equi]|uniref:NACHT domain-containing protein n=1 Tax=Rhodococcus hoagii TaxID=43767 RepID=UPI0015859950|nr:NACHT domain-containing protein [Prescottella equi]
MPAMVAKPNDDQRIPRQQGYGTYLQLLRQLPQHTNPEASAYTHLLELHQKTSNQLLGPKTVKEWRNFLSHGGVAPADKEDGFNRTSIEQLTLELIEEFNTAFKDWSVSVPGTLLGAQVDSPLGAHFNPLVYTDGTSWGFWHSIAAQDGSDVAAYFMLDASNPEFEIEIQNDSTSKLLKEFLANGHSGAASNEIRTFKRAIVSDLKPFEDSTGALRFDVDSDTLPFVLRWRRRTSEGFEERTDLFDISSGDRVRRWIPENGSPETYRDFIRDISNWDLLCSRLSSRGKRLLAKEHEWTAGNFGSANHEFPVERKVMVDDTIGRGFALSQSDVIEGSDGLTNVLDRSVDTQTGIPQIYFLTGEAGIGKTHTLLTISRDRCAKVASTRDCDLPVYLHIDCSGIQLRSLEEAIDSAVNETLILTSGRVFTLCRNGLMVLLIDGFDELLGGAGYRDALQVLRGVIRKLGQSGTMLISARSSYLANQYRSSMNAYDDVTTLAAHQLLSLERWSPRIVEGLFTEIESWAPFRDRFSADEKEMLGLPFFARVFDSWAAQNPQIASGENINLANLLLNAYLDREMKKLHRAKIDEIQIGELNDVLQECCGAIFVSESPDLDEEEFQLCASVALDRDFISSSNSRDRDLINRMTVLCGLSVQRGDSDRQGVRFGFDHRIYYETLLVDFIGQNYLEPSIRQRDPRQARAAFEKEVLSPNVLRGLVSNWTDACVSAVAYLGGSGGTTGGVLSTNIGEVFAVLATNGGRIGKISTLVQLRVRSLDLSGAQLGDIQLIGCSIDSLVLDPTTSGNILLKDVQIGRVILVGDEGAHKTGTGTVELGSQCRIDEVHLVSTLGSQLSDIALSGSDVLSFLARYGWKNAAELLAKFDRQEIGEFEKFVDDVLRKMTVRKQRVFLIEDRSRIPGDTAPFGTHDPTNSKWSMLVDCLTGTGAASRKRINASGTAKSQITFQVKPENLSDKKSHDEVVTHFWETVRTA